MVETRCCLRINSVTTDVVSCPPDYEALSQRNFTEKEREGSDTTQYWLVVICGLTSRKLLLLPEDAASGHTIRLGNPRLITYVENKNREGSVPNVHGSLYMSRISRKRTRCYHWPFWFGHCSTCVGIKIVEPWVHTEALERIERDRPAGVGARVGIGFVGGKKL